MRKEHHRSGNPGDKRAGRLPIHVQKEFRNFAERVKNLWEESSYLGRLYGTELAVFMVIAWKKR
jgi:hypothetical protein